MKYAVIVCSAAMMFFCACSKSDPTPPPVTPPGGGGGSGGTTNRPNFIAGYQSGLSVVNGKFAIYDLNHDDNKDKKYFTIALIPNGSNFLDSGIITTAPKPIDSLGANWPAAVKSASFGTSSKVILSATHRAISLYGDPWNYGTFSTVNSEEARHYRNLNDASYAGTMAGKKPYGYNYMLEELRILPAFPGYRQNYREIVYYFKDRAYNDMTVPGTGLKSLDTIFVGASAIPWTTIDQVVQIEIDPTYFLKKHYYIDWTNWKYHVVEETRGLRAGTSIYQVTFNYRGGFSLDKLCKWPDGWGRP